MEPRAVWSALKAGWWLSAAGLLIGGGIGLVLSLVIGPRYTTDMQFFVSTTDSASTSDVLQGGQFAQQRVASYTGLLSGEQLAGRVIDELDLDMAPEELAGMIGATTVTGTVMIDVTVTDASPVRAERIAHAVGRQFPRLIADLETPEVGTATPVHIEVTDVPGRAVEPYPSLAVRNTLLGAVLGLLAGAALSYARVLLNRTATDPDAVARLTGAPVVGVLFRDGALDQKHTIGKVETRTAEHYRQLRTNLQFLNVDDPPRVIMISSAVPSEGKTTMVINLALALADAGQRVTVVEADLRRPKVTDYLRLVKGVGLTNVLAGQAYVEEVLQTFGDNGLRVLAAGPPAPNPSELLGSRQMAVVLDKLRSDNDFVLVDAAPMLPVADSWGLAAHSDGVLLSVRHGSTRMEQLEEAAASIERVGGTTLGVVLNMVPLRGELARARAQGYEYGYAAGRQPRRG